MLPSHISLSFAWPPLPFVRFASMNNESVAQHRQNKVTLHVGSRALQLLFSWRQSSDNELWSTRAKSREYKERNLENVSHLSLDFLSATKPLNQSQNTNFFFFFQAVAFHLCYGCAFSFVHWKHLNTCYKPHFLEKFRVLRNSQTTVSSRTMHAEIKKYNLKFKYTRKNQRSDSEYLIR